ncbi:hypothetical protein MJO28_010796 [Puccinia striiformis f. sp. tritici]|uniref:BZIP domain-containing protein n=3 Tax=Puccinia striiformis TaxID=27350 RepID=A0A2S4VVT9_9BASI|nr:hypothetical protein MJO28_010796 [Puccinia striiformis f. sp. tritici]POW13620.1 hypothetical protein PSTT_03557 [Puccinia striiformis]
MMSACPLDPRPGWRFAPHAPINFAAALYSAMTRATSHTFTRGVVLQLTLFILNSNQHHQIKSKEAKMQDQDIDYILAQLTSNNAQQTPTNERRTASKTAFIPQLQPTRSGRIPRRTSLNPLDFLEFPDESESDDPDFDPLRNQESIDQLFKDSQQPFTFNPADPIGFDFSTLSNHPEPQQQQQQQPPNNWNTAFDSLNAYNTFNQPSLTDKLSPLTQGELAGVPFVNINLPESDDSPEFIPPPTTRSSAAAAAAAEDLGSSSRPSKRPRRETNTRLLTVDQNSQPNTRNRTPVDVSSKLPKSGQQDLSFNKLPSSISGRYIAIAPSPHYPDHQDQKLNNNYNRSDGYDEEEQTGLQRPNRSSKPGPKPKKAQPSTTNHPFPTITTTSANPHNTQFDDGNGDEREDSMKRKRECMRKNRERKKVYIVSLEDRCLELAEENAKLREENQELIRESRENWKSKAQSLEVFKSLNHQIQSLQQQVNGAHRSTSTIPSNGNGSRSIHDYSQNMRGNNGRQNLKRKHIPQNDENKEDDDDDVQIWNGGPSPQTRLITPQQSSSSSSNKIFKRTSSTASLSHHHSASSYAVNSSLDRSQTLKNPNLPVKSNRGRTLLHLLNIKSSHNSAL